jgi:protein-S-isoprenylcysteine O-methyltransferase Ste14
MSDTLRLIVFVMLLFGLLFGTAGRLDLPWFWALFTAHVVYMLVVLATMPADLRLERFHPAGDGAEHWFRPCVMILGLGSLVIAGLDVGRFQWTGPLPIAIQAAGFVPYLLGLALAAWAMRENRFFAPVVRLQPERGQYVIRTGPYALIRHPGYLAGILISLSSGVVLGSLWSIPPMIAVAGLFIARASLEDRFLRANLAGYVDYAATVRQRLLWGIW